MKPEQQHPAFMSSIVEPKNPPLRQKITYPVIFCDFEDSGVV